MNFKQKFVTSLLKYIFSLSIANCVFAYTFVTLFFQGLSKTTKMSLWRSNGKRQKCRFGAERVKEIEHQRSRAPNFVLQYLYFVLFNIMLAYLF